MVKKGRTRSEQKHALSAGGGVCSSLKGQNSSKSKTKIPLRSTFLAVSLFLEAGFLNVLIVFFLLMDEQQQKFCPCHPLFFSIFIHPSQMSTIDHLYLNQQPPSSLPMLAGSLPATFLCFMDQAHASPY